MTYIQDMVCVLEMAQGSTMQEKGKWLLDEYKRDQELENGHPMIMTAYLKVGLCAYWMNETDEQIYNFLKDCYFAQRTGCFGLTPGDNISSLWAMVCKEMGATRIVAMLDGGYEQEKKNRATKARLQKAMSGRIKKKGKSVRMSKKAM